MDYKKELVYAAHFEYLNITYLFIFALRSSWTLLNVRYSGWSQ